MAHPTPHRRSRVAQSDRSRSGVGPQRQGKKQANYTLESGMKIGRFLGVAAILAFSGSSAPARVSAAAPIACEALGRLPLANGSVTSAQSVPAGGFTLPTPANGPAASAFTTLPAFCRVTARLTPTP